MRTGGGTSSPRRSRRGSLMKRVASTFSAYVLSGLNFPMSHFLKIVQDFYGIVLAELSTNSILMLSSFAFFCKMFVGVRANLCLWHHFFSLRSSGQGKTLAASGSSAGSATPPCTSPQSS